VKLSISYARIVAAIAADEKRTSPLLAQPDFPTAQEVASQRAAVRGRAVVPNASVSADHRAIM